MRGTGARAALVAAVAALGLLVTACTGSSPRTSPVHPAPRPASEPHRPNIVFVLTDDLAWNLVQYMPHVIALQHSGMTFSNYSVTDSRCCPSRASILTGEFPHDTRVFTNTGPDGGWPKFFARNEENHTFGTALQQAGYRTGFFGKFLNGYQPRRLVLTNRHVVPGDYVPPGWSRFVSTNGHGYAGYNYELNVNRHLHHYGSKPHDFINTQLQRLSDRFVTASTRHDKPFMLEVSTFTPHSPYATAPRDIGTFPRLRAPRTPAYDRMPRHATPWLASHAPLSRREEARIDRAFEKRVEAVQSVDRIIGSLEARVAAAGQSRNTVFVFSSDNGYHMGEYRLQPGKFTAFDTDVRVPLIVAGPGVPAGSVNSDVTENIDLAPTFEQIAGAAVPANVDGAGLLDLLHGRNVPWRTVALIEHHGPLVHPRRTGPLPGLWEGDPDKQTFAQGNPPTYQAIRTSRFTYVRYANGEREYYDRQRDPNELDNLAGRLSTARLHRLDHTLDRLRHCHGTKSCWAAGRPTAV